MNDAKLSPTDKTCKTKCIVKKLIYKCKHCGDVSYIDINMRISADCEVDPNIVYQCTCKNCNRISLESNLLNTKEELIISTLKDKGYNPKIHQFTRNITGLFDYNLVKQTMEYMPYGWEYIYNQNSGLYEIQSTLNPTNKMYLELIVWIKQYFEDNEFTEV